MLDLESTHGRCAVQIDTYDQFNEIIRCLIAAKPDANRIWLEQINRGERDSAWFERNAPIGIHTRIDKPSGYCSQWASLEHFRGNGYRIIHYDEIVECDMPCENPTVLTKALFD